MSFIDSIRKYDTWLVERVFEPLAWRIEYYTGKNNFWCARAVLILYLVGRLIETEWTLAGDVIFSILVFGIATSLFWSSIFYEKIYNRKFKNFLIVSGFPTRIICLLLIGMNLFTFTSPPFIVGSVGFALYFYFLACSPMPPHWNQAKEERRQAKLVPQAQS